MVAFSGGKATRERDDSMPASAVQLELPRDMIRFLRLLIVLACLALTPQVWAASSVTLFRLFLLDGGVLVSYGEFVRHEDGVVFSMLAGGPSESPRLQAVTVPSDLVDWPRTERYAESARYQRYAETRGGEDYLILTNEVAAALNGIALSADPRRALALAEAVRERVAAWPQSHYGFRSQDIREIVSVLDQAVLSLRAATGANAFDVSLFAMAGPPPLEPVLGMPTVIEQIDQAFRLAAVATVASDRVALYETALALSSDVHPLLPAADAAIFRQAAQRQLEEEVAADRRYADLSRRLLTRATRAAARADVGEIEQILVALPREDVRLGARRPGIVQALSAMLRSRLGDAQYLRLRRDQWALRRASYRQYERSVGSSLLVLVGSTPSLDAIRDLRGPDPEALLALRAQLSGGAEHLERMPTPEYVRDVHEQLIGAWRFAENAVTARFDAITGTDTTVAWEASSSAAGALMMIARVQRELLTLLEQPQLQ
jgi:hypothetical protein